MSLQANKVVSSGRSKFVQAEKNSHIRAVLSPLPVASIPPRGLISRDMTARDLRVVIRDKFNRYMTQRELDMEEAMRKAEKVRDSPEFL